MNTIQLTTFAIAFALSASKYLEHSRPLWSYLPSWAQRLMPSVLMVAGALPGLIDRSVSHDAFFGIVITAVALFLPSKNPAPTPKSETTSEQ